MEYILNLIDKYYFFIGKKDYFDNILKMKEKLIIKSNVIFYH